jgi:hypothetical protein
VPERRGGILFKRKPFSPTRERAGVRGHKTTKSILILRNMKKLYKKFGEFKLKP